MLSPRVGEHQGTETQWVRLVFLPMLEEHQGTENLVDSASVIISGGRATMHRKFMALTSESSADDERARGHRKLWWIYVASFCATGGTAPVYRKLCGSKWCYHQYWKSTKEPKMLWSQLVLAPRAVEHQNAETCVDPTNSSAKAGIASGHRNVL